MYIPKTKMYAEIFCSSTSIYTEIASSDSFMGDEANWTAS